MFDWMDGYTRVLLVFAGINVIAAYSFYVPYKTGQVSLGQAGFMAVGAYSSAILTQKFGVPFAVALVFRLIHLHPTARLARVFFARWRLRMMDLAVAVHMKGFGCAFR